jgi:hypothetical protein
MLKNLLEKLRGQDNWPEVQAVVRSILKYDEEPTRGYALPRNFAEVTFAYTDTQQEHQYGSITVEDSSSLYDAKENDTFTIRVNPAHPEKYYSPDGTTP